MKKIIATMLIIIMLFTFIMPKTILATEPENKKEEYNAYEGLIEHDGQVMVNGRFEKPRDTSNAGDTVLSILALTSSAIAEAIRYAMTFFVEAKDEKITIQGMISGEYPILNNDFLLSKVNNSTNGGKIHSDIKSSVSSWYYAIRNLAITISLLMLIYIGIRMAISTLSDDKAKYKKMLIGWVQSFILIFFLHYIMIVAMAIQKVLLEVFGGFFEGITSPEGSILDTCFSDMMKAHGWDILWSAVLYWVLTYYQIKFLMLYVKRVIATAFLVIISPLITVTYSIDKIADNKAQAFNAWLQEFVVNIFIQPIHMIVYLIFIVSASQIFEKVPLFTVIFFGALSRGEKVIKGIFGMRSRKSINSIGKHR